MGVVVGTDVVDCEGVNATVVSVGTAAMNATVVMVVVDVDLTIVLSAAKSSWELCFL